MPDIELIEQAKQALNAGDRQRAQGLLTQRLAADPKDIQAWLWLSECFTENEKKRYCLERALAIQPENAQARQALEQLAAAPPAEENPPVDEIGAATPPVAGQSPEDIKPASPKGEDILAPEAGVSAVEEPASETPALKAIAPPLPKKRAGFSRAQNCLIILLALLMFVAVGALALIVLQNQALGFPADPSLPAQAPLIEAPVTYFEFPPTWTPTPSQAPNFPEPPLALTSTPGVFQTSLPSLTPISSDRVIVIGRSAENRPIEVHRFGSGQKERLMIFGIHGGDEGNTIALADELIAHLRRNRRIVPPGYTLYILRSLNPDGEALGNVTEGRLNGNGVDLNRNFDVGWKADWRSNGCSSLPGTGGSGPGSEPETQALKDFLGSRNVEALISYHSAYLGVFPSGDPPHPESARLAQAIHDISNYPYPPVRNGCEYTGTLVDWAASNGVLAAVDLELNSGVDTEFETNLGVLSLLLSFEPQAPATAPPPGTSTVAPSDIPTDPTATQTTTDTPTVTPTLNTTPTP
jgi:hypothetical protein